MDRLWMAACIAAALFLSACSGGHGTVGPVSAAAGVSTPAVAKAFTRLSSTVALFQPSRGVLPYPTDLYFSGSTDGTVNIQPANALLPRAATANSLDGFSTTAPIRARFGGRLEPASFTAQSVILLQVTIDNTTKATTGAVRPLVFGVDFTASLAQDAGVGNSILEIRPSHPLVPSTDVIDNGYLVLLTRKITDTSGKAVAADTDYASIKAALPSCDAITDHSLHRICQQTGAHLQLAQASGVNPADVVLSFSFTTQSISDTLAAIERTATAQPLVVHNTELTTAQVDARLSGHATLYVGTLTVPYYLSRKAPLTGFWQGNPSPLDAGSRVLTRFNPMPVATEMLRIPVLATVPNGNSAVGSDKPANGWPVLIYAHGLNRSRADVLAVADSFADSGFVVVAIDLPLHGVTDPASLLYASGSNPLYAGLGLPAAGSIERTADLDLVNNTTGAAGPDGRIDPSGANFINLTNLLTTRDNLRQGAADLITLTRSLPNLNLDNDPAGDIDPTAIHFLGHSLGAMVGTLFLGVTSKTEVSTATLAMPGGGLPYLLRDSPTLGPRVIAGLEAQELSAGNSSVDELLRDAQTALDAGDPLNFMAAAAASHPVHLFQIIGSQISPADQVIPNSATQRLIDAAGLTRIAARTSAGNSISDPNGFRSYVNFLVGDHGSLVDPTASMAVTTEMQAEAITFTGAPVPPVPLLSFPGSAATPGGTAVVMLNPTVLQP